MQQVPKEDDYDASRTLNTRLVDVKSLTTFLTASCMCMA